MKTVPLSEAKDKLSGLVEEVETTHERVRITRHGHGAAVVIAEDDLEAMTETIRLLATPGAVEELRQAVSEYAAGDTTTGEDLRRRYGLSLPRESGLSSPEKRGPKSVRDAGAGLGE